MTAPYRADAAAFPPRPPLSRELGAMFALAWPLIVTNFSGAGMMTTDVVMLGWLSPEALAAGSIGFNAYFPIFLFGLGVVAAASPLAAHVVGADRNDRDGVRAIAHQALISALLFCPPIWLLLWFTGPILRAIGEPPALADSAGVYVHGVEWTLLPALGMVALRAVFAALDRVGPVLIAGVLALAVNAVLDYGLIFGKFGLPAYGVFGSGLATATANLFMFLVLAAYALFDRQLAAYRILTRMPRWDWAALRRLWRLGLPSGSLVLSEVSIFAGSFMAMGLLGIASVEAHAAVLQIASLAFSVPLGLGQAASVRIGQAFGARDGAGVRQAGTAALALTVGFAAASALAMVAFPKLLLSAFFDLGAPDAEEAITLALSFLWVAAAFQVFDGLQVALTNMLRGVHDARVPLILALLGYWGVGAPLGVALAFLTPLKGLGIWIGLAVGLASVSALEGLRWRAVVRRSHL